MLEILATPNYITASAANQMSLCSPVFHLISFPNANNKRGPTQTQAQKAFNPIHFHQSGPPQFSEAISTKFAMPPAPAVAAPSEDDKNQYERKLKDWGCRKNLNHEEWNFVLCRKRLREEIGRESHFTMYGVAKTQKKIKKEQTRYTISQLNDIHQQAVYANPKTPQGMTVQTPREATFRSPSPNPLRAQTPHSSRGDVALSPIPNNSSVRYYPAGVETFPQQGEPSPMNPAGPSAIQTYYLPTQTPEQSRGVEMFPSSPAAWLAYFEQPITLPEDVQIPSFEFSQELTAFSPSPSISGVADISQNTLLGEVSTLCVPPSRVISKEKLMPNLPFFQYLEFIRSQDTTSVMALLSDNREASEYQSYSRPFFDSGDTIFGSETTSWDSEFFAHSRFTVAPVPTKVLQDLYSALRGRPQIPRTLETTSEKLEDMLGNLMLEKEVGDLELMTRRLIGPSDVHSVMEFINLLIYFSSNSMIFLEKQASILQWVVNQKKAVIERMILVPLPSIKAFFQAMISTAMNLRDEFAGRYLLNADKQRVMYSGHRGYLLRLAVEINAIDLARQFLDEMARSHKNINEPLHLANDQGTILEACLVVARKVEMAVLLLEAGAKVGGHSIPDENSQRAMRAPMRNAISRGDLKLVQLFLH
ncbi:hypothetical protein HYFRA_00001469 [Hymenoscyphus fraxineus]|uniref:Clr5 domain-containing protein n=1 Tax=Hymenoscyphus fraxineus TaxID=746836 RepID=A0A9N9L7M5_9HELO|nr:hypothetical protein HYFRA_00001469 [Hymenoscyphus fraxineus]